MLLEVRDVCKTYKSTQGPHAALEGVSLDVDQGECVGLIGCSGSGKSTLASIIAGLERADSGSVRFDGVSLPVSGRRAKRTAQVRGAYLNMQMVFQNPASTFSDRMRIGEGVMEGLAYRPGFDRSTAQGQVMDALEMVGLGPEHAKKYAWELSGGQCQRAAIARAIVSRPKLLICDEPTSALDATVQAGVINQLVALFEELGMACLFISHDLALVRGFCERLYVLGEGRVVEQGRTDQVFSNPQAQATKDLLSAVIRL